MVNDRCVNINNFTINQSGGTVSVQNATLGGHTDYLQLFDNNASSNVWAQQTFVSGQNYGTMYLYMRTTDVTKESDFQLITYNIACWVRISDSKLQANYGGAWHDIVDPVSNDTWYECKLEFETTTGGYQGLGQNRWNFWVDGVKLVDAQSMSNAAAVTYIKIHSNNTDSNYYAFYDNLYYSWDGITKPSGSITETSAKSGSIQEISGYLKATINFEGDLPNTLPADWTDESAGDGWGLVKTGTLNHKKAIQLHSPDSSSAGHVSHTFADGSAASGTIECYLASSDVTYGTLLRLRQDASNRIWLYMDSDKFYYYKSGYQEIVGTTPQDNYMHHIRIDFECGSGGYQGLSADYCYIYIDQTKYGPYPFGVNALYISSLQILQATADPVFDSYLSAIGISWDSNYTIGDNLDYEIGNKSGSISESNKKDGIIT